MKSWLKQFTTEDWIIVFVGAVVLALACIFPAAMPSMPKKLLSSADWINAVYMFGFVLLLTCYTCGPQETSQRNIRLPAVHIRDYASGAAYGEHFGHQDMGIRISILRSHLWPYIEQLLHPS